MSTGTRVRCRPELRLLVGLCLAASVPAAAGGELRGPAEVLAGDRLRVAGTELALAGIDAPEPGQMCELGGRNDDCGRIAATALMDLTAGVEITCRIVGPGDPPRARCRGPDGWDLSEGMVYTGWALVRRREDPTLLARQRIARERRHGLWRGRFVEP